MSPRPPASEPAATAARPVGLGSVVWITGVPASGKTTLAANLVAFLKERGVPVLWLDSDELRSVMTPNPTYSDSERDAFYGTVGLLGEKACRGGICALVSATAQRRTYRDTLRSRVESLAPGRFVEIHLVCDPATVRQRDIKGLYGHSDAGDISRLPGEGAAYETPLAAELTIDSASVPAASVATLARAELERRGLVPPASGP